jgi:hypothetical protein
MSLSTVNPLLRLPGIHGSTKVASSISISADVLFLFLKESGIDWKACCLSMNRVKTFSPHFSICGDDDDDDGIVNNIFYIQRYDVFLKLTLNERSGELVTADIIEKECNPTKHKMIFETVVNFLLHYMWHSF